MACRVTKSEWSIFVKKQQQGGEKKAKSHNKKKTYIAWEENASSSSSDSSDEEEAYLCLMVDNEVESVVSSFESKTKLDENYDKLLDNFNDMHEEDQKLS